MRSIGKACRENVVILEAFATYLHSADPGTPAVSVLRRWLWERLSTPPECMADRVLRAEIKLEVADRKSSQPQVRGWSISAVPGYVFTPTSDSGRRLLRSLYEYASSYE